MNEGERRLRTIQINKHEIGAGCSPYIICEVGSNWECFQDAKESIPLAKAAGANAVKFQLYDEKALYGYVAQPSGIIPGTMPKEWIPLLKEKAGACGIDFLCSTFSPELMEYVDPFVWAHKIASAELTHVRMLQKANFLGKPVILSTGASGDADIKAALEYLPDVPVILLYCVSSYPSNTARLENIQDLRSKFCNFVGFSDHSTDIYTIPGGAVKAGACVIEKTMKIRDMPSSVDNHYSLLPLEFDLMVKGIRGQLGSSRVCGSENEMITMHNRRIIASQNINVGEVLTLGFNIEIARSRKHETHAYSPFSVDAHGILNGVNGRNATRSISQGDGIGPGDVEWV